jgi:hypothetical protein
MSNTTDYFSTQKLQARGGYIYCLVFENEAVGIKRNLFWSFSLEFEPIGNESEMIMTCEWVPRQFRHWKELDGLIFQADYDENGIEGSFYVCGHDAMKHVSVSVQYTQNNFFELAMEMSVDFQGSEFFKPEPDLLVKGCAVVPFRGLFLGQGIGLSDAEKYIDITSFESEPSKNEFDVPYYKPKYL